MVYETQNRIFYSIFCGLEETWGDRSHSHRNLSNQSIPLCETFAAMYCSFLANTLTSHCFHHLPCVYPSPNSLLSLTSPLLLNNFSPTLATNY